MPWIAPNTILEKFYASCIVMLGAIFFASLLGSIVAAIAAVDKSGERSGLRTLRPPSGHSATAHGGPHPASVRTTPSPSASTASTHTTSTSPTSRAG